MTDPRELVARLADTLHHMFAPRSGDGVSVESEFSRIAAEARAPEQGQVARGNDGEATEDDHMAAGSSRGAPPSPAPADDAETVRECDKCAGVMTRETRGAYAGMWGCASCSTPATAQGRLRSVNRENRRLAARLAQFEALEKWIEAHPFVEIVSVRGPQDAENAWAAHERSGGINDTHWREIATGPTWRVTVERAIAALAKGGDGDRGDAVRLQQRVRR